LERTEPGGDELGAVGQEQQHAVARSYAERAQALARAVRHPAHLAVRIASIAAQDRSLAARLSVEEFGGEVQLRDVLSYPAFSGSRRRSWRPAGVRDTCRRLR